MENRARLENAAPLMEKCGISRGEYLLKVEMERAVNFFSFGRFLLSGLARDVTGVQRARGLLRALQPTRGMETDSSLSQDYFRGHFMGKRLNYDHLKT